jgi:hypothetical protein
MPLTKSSHIRSINRSDYKEIYKIWEKFYSQEFEFPDFITNYLSVFVVHDEESIIVTAGIRTITEIVAVTNKDKSVRDRQDALHQILWASKFTCARTGYNQMHAFVQDDKWSKHLQKVGFRPTIGQALVIDVKD